jgi:N-acetylmuramoyl-L-alanine amidase
MKHDHPPKRRLSLLSRKSVISLGMLGMMSACQKKVPRLAQSHGIYYKVKPGDTLHRIARACGLSVGDLSRANGLVSNDLAVGTVLQLPYLNHYPKELLDGPSNVGKAPGEKPWLGVNPNHTPDLESDLGLKVVHRHQWGAKPSKSNSSPMNGIKRITLHHTSEYPGMNQLTDRQTIQAIARYHRDSLNWADIGYHYLIGRDGKIYEGRPVSLQGAHTGGHNTHNLGISVIGHFVKNLPSDRQLNTLKILLSSKLKEHDLSISKLYGHRDLKPTECPGERLYLWLQQFKAQYHTA